MPSLVLKFSPVTRTLFSAAMVHVFRDRTHHNSRAKHKLIVNGIGVCIVAEIHRQPSHNGITVIGYLTCKRINIRHQAITQIIEFFEHRGKFSELPYFSEIRRQCERNRTNEPNWNIRVYNSWYAGSLPPLQKTPS